MKMANKTLNNFIVYTLVQFQIFIVIEILCSLWLSEDPRHCSNCAFGISAMTCKTQMHSYGIAVVPVSSSDQSTTDVVREFISSRCGKTVSQFHKKKPVFPCYNQYWPQIKTRPLMSSDHLYTDASFFF